MINTKEEFKEKINEIQSQSWYKNPIGFGIARIDRGQLNSDKILVVQLYLWMLLKILE